MKYYLSVLLSALCLITSAQEVLAPLSYNSQLANKQHAALKTSIDTLELPFREDFSVYHSSYPDSSKWLDRLVFINADLPLDPVSIGVATFDGLDELGQAYSFANPSNSSFGDELTSQPINLSYSVADSIYLSFYFQAGGRGNKPEAEDSLKLEFKSSQISWTPIWSVGGGQSMSSFEQVMLPILDTFYLDSAFQFRFRNFGSKAGNIDHWHVDYIILDKDRTRADTMPDDVCFIERPAAFFENGYRSLPWSHFQANQSLIQDTLSFLLVNRSVNIKNVDYRYRVSDDQGFTYTHPTASNNVNPSEYYSRIYNTPFTIPQASQQRNDILLEFFLNTQPDINGSNDTIKEHIVMNDYYAYDDGTAELAYGLQGANAELALAFDIPANISDSLAGVLIHFAQLVEDITQRRYSLRVYEADGNAPGQLIYNMDTLIYPSYQLFRNGFTYVPFDTTIFLNGGSSGKRYFIAMHKLGANPINIGLDRNSNAKNYLFYNFGGNWNQSLIDGAIMFRPVMGNYQTVLSAQAEEVQEGVKVYPNPFRDVVYLEHEGLKKVQVYSIEGKLVLQEEIETKQLNLSGLHSGIYLLRIFDEQGVLRSTEKLIKQ